MYCFWNIWCLFVFFFKMVIWCLCQKCFFCCCFFPLKEFVVQTMSASLCLFYSWHILGINIVIELWKFQFPMENRKQTSTVLLCTYDLKTKPKKWHHIGTTSTHREGTRFSTIYCIYYTRDITSLKFSRHELATEHFPIFL